MGTDGLFSMPPKQVYGCLKCQSGREQTLATVIQILNPGIIATAVKQTKRHTLRGVTRLQDDVLLIGYVFIKAPEDTDISSILPSGENATPLMYTDGEWRLFGQDRDYANWVFKYNGVIRLSKAYQLNDCIQIVDGPLKDLEGQITKIDRRNKSGQVTIHFGGNTIKAWLGFEIIKEYKANERPLAACLK